MADDPNTGHTGHALAVTRRARWLKPVLFASLALNLLVLGALASGTATSSAMSAICRPNVGRCSGNKPRNRAAPSVHYAVRFAPLAGTHSPRCLLSRSSHNRSEERRVGKEC